MKYMFTNSPTATNLVTVTLRRRRLAGGRTKFRRRGQECYSDHERPVSSGSVFGQTVGWQFARRRNARQSVHLSSQKFSGKGVLFICSTQSLIPIWTRTKESSTFNADAVPRSFYPPRRGIEVCEGPRLRLAATNEDILFVEDDSRAKSLTSPPLKTVTCLPIFCGLCRVRIPHPTKG